MKRNEQARAVLFDMEARELGELSVKQGEWLWPQGTGGWSQTLDCTVEPYAQESLEENLAVARRVRKRYVARALDPK
ncbi:MAG: hypothetical protein RBU37_22315 [Myxococcota bacterium]|jgi:hypothetical protein|nr:hypothetical protein [Myxococcota bacterium]